MSRIQERNESRLKLETSIREALAQHADDKDPAMVAEVLGRILATRHPYDPYALSSTEVPWMLDAYVAAVVGPLAKRLLAVHQHLVASGATAEAPYDFEHCDRYGVAFADAKWKSMALRTQNYTYMVVLEPRSSFSELPDGQLTQIEGYAIHIRMCTAGRYSCDFSRPSFGSVAFLGDKASVCPEDDRSSACDYFRYKDGRDRGYLCSVEPAIVGEGYRCENISWGSAYGYLRGVLQDLASHYDCLPKTSK